MKKAFTMIELIFVIVILGILAAIAIPKFLGVANQAHEANLKSFVGALNRTVGPTLWSEAISEGEDGNISYLDLVYDKANSNDQNLSKYISVPKEIEYMDLSKCDDPSRYKIVGYADKTVTGQNYFIACRDGNNVEAPDFALVKQTFPLNQLTSKNLGDYNITSINTNPVKFNGGEKGPVLLK